MKSRLSRILLSILILCLALHTFTLPAQAQSEPDENQSRFENIPPDMAERYQIHPETAERPEYIPPSPEIIAKTQAQVASFDCANVTDVPQIECEALVALYESTNGAGWLNNSGWLEGTNVAAWYGVMVGYRSKSVESLFFYHNQLNGSIPSELGNLPNLLVLRLDGNQLIGSIPAEIASNSSIWDLELNNNLLSGSIPAELGAMSNLEYLDLSDNQLSGRIPSALGNLSILEVLHLNNNQLTGSIPLYFVNLTKLNYFNASETSLCEPTTPDFLAWKSQVYEWIGTGVICGEEKLTLTHLPLIFR